MAHDLTIRADGSAEMAWVGATPWHGLGNELQAGASLDAWRRASGMDFTILRAAVRYPTNPADANNPAAWRKMDDRHVLLRSDTGDALGIVSDQYRELQPGDALATMHAWAERAGATLETAGTLQGGRRFWALARLPGEEAVSSLRDVIRSYLLLSTSADGSLATEARRTTIRVVCANTLGIARRHGADYRVTHRQEFDAEEAAKALQISGADVARDFATQMEEFRTLAAFKVSPATAHRMTLDTLHGADAVAAMSEAERAKAGKARVVRAIDGLVSGEGLIGADVAGLGTAWAWLNAMTQHVDHGAQSRSDAGRLDSAWFGRGEVLKRSALDVALVHAGVSI